MSKGVGFVLRSAFIAAFVGFLLVVVLFVALRGGGGDNRELLIPRGASMKQVSEILARNEVIDKPYVFKLLLRATGGNRRVRAGEFRFKEGMGLLGALNTLYNSEPIIHQVTVPEGWNVRQIAGILAKAGLADEQKFLSLTLTPQAAAHYKINAPSLEGYLYPDTYGFSKIDGEERIVDTMVKHFFAKFDKTMQDQARALGWSMEQVVTLASIVEKETGTADDPRMIASVFHNRLRKKMRLQSDPTTIYGMANYHGNISKRDLLTPTPYNTYTIPALPPGAIASPGLRSLQATLNPAPTNYLYFVSNNQGKSLFSATLKEHNQNVAQWQVQYFRKKNREIGKASKN